MIFQKASINAIRSIRRLAGDKTFLRWETLVDSQWLILRSLVQAGLEVVKVAAIILMVFGHIDYIVNLRLEFSAICRNVYPEEKIVVVYPGTNIQLGSCAADQPVPPGTTPYILYLGALALNKNVDGLLRIFARCIHDHRLDMNLILTGKDFCGPDHWKSLVSRLGIAERVKFRGWVTDSEREALLNGATMLWQFSWYEGFGLPVLEAASRGIPVLCSNRGALPEIIQNPDQEMDPADETAAAARASDALRSPSVLSDWKARGLRRAAEFTWAKSVHRLTSYIEAAIE